MINLAKATEAATESFVVRLEKETKKTGIEHEIVAEVKFIIDISGSMNSRSMSGRLYSDGIVNEIMSRFYPVAVILDDNKLMEVYPFSTKCEKIDVSVDENNYENFVKNEILDKDKSWYFGGTSYTVMIQKIIEDCPKAIPQLCICIVDGDTSEKSKARELIKKSADTPTFFLFLGIGKNSREFSFLESLDDMKEDERLIDNVDFHYIKDISTLSDKELYDMVCNEFIGWYYKAKEINLF